MLETQPEVGSTANTYAILAKLATGGMAEIFLARTESAAGVERYVVLKRVLRHHATDIKFIHMFLDEARLASQLQHPNIAQVFDTGKLGDSYFFTMEYVHGETVRELLHRAFAVGQPVPIGCALTIVAGAAAGLQHAHERIGLDGKPLGIVHRDVSPSNLMISYEGHIKVVDFGVAKATHQSIETQTGSVKGKIGYMSPEQCRGGIVDPRCDLFSLGIVMWELLVGERLFKRATDFESMEAIVTEPSPLPSSRRPDVPKALDAIVQKLLAKSPDDRYQNADELLEAIETVAVRARIALSVPGLRRFVRELFGQRPEPWVEMRIRDASPEVVTVTGAPLLGKPDIASLVDSQLDRLLDLSTITTEPIADVPTGPTVAGEPVLKLLRSEPPVARSSSRIPVAHSGTWPEAVAPARAPRNQTTLRTRLDKPQPQPRSRLLVIGGIAILGIAAGAVIYTIANRRVHQVANLERGGAPVDAMQVAPPSDAEVSLAQHDANERDAAEVALAPADAQQAPAVHETVAPHVRRKPTRDEELAAVYRAARFADVVGSCSANARLAVTSAETCTLAACQQHEVDKARRWLQKISASKRDSLIDTCNGLGSSLVKADPPRPDPPKPPKPPKPKCDESDPMACRR